MMTPVLFVVELPDARGVKVVFPGSDHISIVPETIIVPPASTRDIAAVNVAFGVTTDKPSLLSFPVDDK